MRVVICVVLAVLALFGCGKKPPSSSGIPNPNTRVASQKVHVEPASLAGSYIGKLTPKETPGNSPLPPSIREVVGDATLTLKAEGQTFTMTHKGLNLGGSFKVDGDQLVLQVEQVEGLGQDALASVNLVANRKAKREPSSPEMLALFQEILLLTDWRFQLTAEGFDQVGTGSSPPRYRFKKKKS